MPVRDRPLQTEEAATVPTLTDHDGIWLLDLGADENRLGARWVAEVQGCLDRVTAAEAGGLVTTGSGRFYSNGLDLDEITAAVPDRARRLSDDIQELLACVLTLPMPTVAALNGHAFGAGAMFALAHDRRLMRADRGFFCLPEAAMGMPFLPGMAALIQARLTPAAAEATMLTGRRFPAEEAVPAGLVHEALPAEGLTEEALQQAAELRHTAGPALGTIKATMYGAVLAQLRAQPA